LPGCALAVAGMVAIGGLVAWPRHGRYAMDLPHSRAAQRPSAATLQHSEAARRPIESK